MSFNFVEKVMCINGGDILPPIQFYRKGFNLGGNGSQPSWQDIILSGNTALTLVNAKEDGLNYVKLFGKCEQRNLPSGYTQVEYLESTGTQYIDTGYKPNNNTSIDIKFSTSSSVHFVFGSRKDTIGDDQQRFCLFVTINKFNPQYGNTNYADAGSFVTSTAYQVQMDKNGLAVDGITIRNFNSENFTSENNLILFGNNTDGTIVSAENRIYYSKISDNDTLIRNLIPCRRNSDNVLGMYDTVTGTFLTNAGTGSFTAGADTTPSPNTPMDIVCNNGVVKVNRNLYSTEYHDKVLSQTDGVTATVVSGAKVNVSAMVDCTNVKSFMITSADPKGSYRLFKYRPDGTFIDAQTSGVLFGQVLVLPSDCGYFRIQYNYTSASADTENILIYDSAHNLGVYTDGTTETVEITGKNLYNPATRVEDYYINASGVITAEQSPNLNSCYSALIPVLPNTNYILSGTQTKSINANKRIHAYDSSGNWLAQLDYLNVTTAVTPYTVSFTTTSSTKYLRISILKTDTNVQVELGSTATTYEPYYNGGTATAENLFKIGTYQDVQSVLDGGVTRNIGVKVLDGTEDWTVITGTYPYFRVDYDTDFALSTNNYGGFCSHFECVNTGSTQNNQGISMYRNSNTGATSLGLKYNDLYPATSGNIPLLKQWLSDQYAQGTPVIIVYPLETATTETVTPQPMNIQEGTNNVTITQASMDNLELEVKYKAGVAVTITEVQNAQLDNNVEVTING